MGIKARYFMYGWIAASVLSFLVSLFRPELRGLLGLTRQ